MVSEKDSFSSRKTLEELRSCVSSSATSPRRSVKMGGWHCRFVLMVKFLVLESCGVGGGVRGIESDRLLIIGIDRAEDTEGRLGISMTAARVGNTTVAVSYTKRRIRTTDGNSDVCK